MMRLAARMYAEKLRTFFVGPLVGVQEIVNSTYAEGLCTVMRLKVAEKRLVSLSGMFRGRRIDNVGSELQE